MNNDRQPEMTGVPGRVCQHCRKPIGYIGRVLQVIFGCRFLPPLDQELFDAASQRVRGIDSV